MFKNKTLALVGALALAVFAAQPASAQDYPPQNPPSTDNGRTPTDQASGTIRGERVLPGRIGGDRRDNANQRDQQRQRRQPRQPAPPTPEENLAAAQGLTTAMGLDCQVSEANRLGVNAENQAMYEAVCGAGQGYIVVASTPPQNFACLELLSQGEAARSHDPNADVGLQCANPHNLDTKTIIGGFAREAGITCAVDQAAVIGKLDNDVVYEAGCPGADGYWLQKTAGAWVVTDCTEVVMTQGVCRFTTPEEQAASFQPKLAGTDASDCQVQQVRLMGSNANGKFYEAKCSAGDGYIARLDTAGVTQQVYACSIAQHIGGGCTLTEVPAAPATTEE